MTLSKIYFLILLYSLSTIISTTDIIYSPEYVQYGKIETNYLIFMYRIYLNGSTNEAFVKELSIRSFTWNWKNFLEAIIIKKEKILGSNINSEFSRAFYEVSEDSTKLLKEILINTTKNISPKLLLNKKEFCLLYRFLNLMAKNKILLENKNWKTFVKNCLIIQDIVSEFFIRISDKKIKWGLNMLKLLKISS